MPKKPPPDWARIRARYETSDIPVIQLAAEEGVVRSTIYERIRMEGWSQDARPRNSAPGTPTLADRLTAAILRELEALEKIEGLTLADHERRARTTASLVRQFDKLAGWRAARNAKARAKDGARAGSFDRDAAWRRILDRLHRLLERGEPEEAAP